MLSFPLLALCLLIISNCFMTLAWYGHLKIYTMPRFGKRSCLVGVSPCWNTVYDSCNQTVKSGMAESGGNENYTEVGHD